MTFTKITEQYSKYEHLEKNLGIVKGNKMVDIQLGKSKLVDRGVKMIMGEIPVSYDKAAELLAKYGSVRKAVNSFQFIASS